MTLTYEINLDWVK